MKIGIIILMLASVALLYYIVSTTSPSIGSSFDHIPIESIQ